MERSNSTASTASSSKQDTTEPFAYQTRLLERTTSLARNASLSSRGTFGSPVSSPTIATRKWAPSHRITNSVDSVRSQWEERARADSLVNENDTGSGLNITISNSSQSSLRSRLSPTKVVRESTEGHQAKRDLYEASPATSPSYSQSSALGTASPLVKRHTLPAPILTSPLSPNTTGLTVEAVDSELRSSDQKSLYRIHLPISGSSHSSSFQSNSPRSQFQARPSSPVKRERDDQSWITHPSSSPVKRYHTEPNVATSTSYTREDKSVSLSTTKYKGNSDSANAISHSDASSPSHHVSSSFSSTYPSPQLTTPSRTRANTFNDALQPVPLSPSKVRNLASSFDMSNRTPVSVSPERTSKPIPLSPSTSSSVMSPTPYRSSYLTNKRASAYGDQLTVDGKRRLGRHLPRIASGDGSESTEQKPLTQVSVNTIPATESAKLSRLERREQRMREWERELEKTPIRKSRLAEADENFPSVTSAEDVTGIPGRLRLSKDKTPSTPSSPLPSSRITRGLWADTQRHLLQAYEYLCHVGEAQQWIEGCLGEELGFGVVEMEESLRNGVVLAKLVRAIQGEAVVKRIYEAPKLDFRHSDNINHFLAFVRRVGLPEFFVFELTDLYNKKNLPKVIYCIHALSHLLSRRGLAERIGNLVGHLKFSDDQLQQTDKGLKASGVAIPNFGNVGRELAKEINEEPEVEPETDDERRDRLLLENEDSIAALQSIARGFLARKGQATQRVRLRLAEKYIIRLQSYSRGVLVRRHILRGRQQRIRMNPWVTELQARLRGVLARRALQKQFARIRQFQLIFIKLQAQCRGALQRQQYLRLRAALVKSKTWIISLQSLARAKIAWKSQNEVKKVLSQNRIAGNIVSLQALSRRLLVKRSINNRRMAMLRVNPNIIQLQAQIRGVLVRRRIKAQMSRFDDVMNIMVRIQAATRCYLARKRLLNLIRGLRKAIPSIVTFQAQARSKLQYQRHQILAKALSDVQVVSAVNNTQALARAALVRKRRAEQAKRFELTLLDVKGFQAVARGALVRREFISWRDHLHSSQAEATTLQALFRGVMERQRFRARMQYYRSNLDKVVHIQALFRGKETREQYRQLTLGKNVNVGTIKNFVHLLDDSEADFEDEIEIERLRKRVVESIRENQLLETDVNELDVKIALVVQNVKSFEELIKARRRHGADSAAAHASRASILAAHGDPFAGPNTLDHTTKRKLELYQQLFYLLQTHGEYFSRLFFKFTKTEIPEKSRRLTERVVLTLFSYGQDRREEYLLLKLFQTAIAEEIGASNSIAEIMCSHPTYVDVAVPYLRPKQANYIRESLQTVIKEVVQQDDLDLETDPSVIYRSRINAEEMKTGQKSSKPKDVAFHEAVDDPETRAEFIRNLQKLHALTKDFVKTILGSITKLPYGVRCIARETLLALKAKFPNESDTAYGACIGKFIYYRYINPAIVAPETFDIVTSTIGIAARKNLAEISRMLTQISSGTTFDDENLGLTPLNSYVAEGIKQMSAWFLQVADVDDAETHFHAHEFLDVTAQPKLIYITPNEVYSMHSLLTQYLEFVAPLRDDPLRAILLELGGVPNLGTDELKDARDRVISLELTNRFANVKDPHADEKALWVQAKRGVLAILRVQPAKDLVEALMQPVTDEHELFWEDIVDREMMTDKMRARQRRMPSTNGADSAYRLEDIGSLSFREVKAHAIYFLLELEKREKVTRTDGYQSVLNAIAADVRSKHRKRLQRQQELESMHDALRHLAERKKYFEEQIRSYHNYVEAAMNTMQRGKGKKRFVMPFTKQYFHLRDLHRSGKSPQFGSFRYSALDLYDKEILLSINQYSPRQFDRIDFVLSSNQAGVFNIEMYNLDSGTSTYVAATDLRMEDLLHAQFENRTALPLFDGMVKFNLNLLLYQLNKKFYV